MANAKKSPALAGVLNFFLFGGGTVYLGKRAAFGVVLTIGGTMAQVAEILISPPVYNLAPTIWPFLLGGLVIAKIALVMDAVREAREINGAA